MKKIVIGIVLIGMTAAFARADVSVEAIEDATLGTVNGVHTTYGSDTNLAVRYKYSENYSRKTYVKFDLSGVSYDAEDSATFSVTCLSSPDYDARFNVYGLEAGFDPGTSGDLGTDWTEATIDWANAPANVEDSGYAFSSAVDPISTVYMTAGSITNGLVLNYTIARLGDFLQSDETVTITLSSYGGTEGEYLYLASSENATYAGPTLTVIPEPGSVSLVVIGAGALLFARKRL